MRICDGSYLKALRKEVEWARKALPSEVAKAIDSEIEAIKKQGGSGPWYSTRVIAKAFNISHPAVTARASPAHLGFQGSLPECGRFKYGDWLEACGVNKDTNSYHTWPHPSMAIEALDLAHHLERYTPSHNNQGGQRYIDKRRREHGNDRNGHYGAHGVSGAEVRR